MSERLPTTETESPAEPAADAWGTGDHYSLLKVDAGTLGESFYYSLPPFTILAKTKEDLDKVNADFSALFAKYTDDIIVGTSYEASLILSLNQAAADLSGQSDVINVLRAKIFDLTGSYDDAGNWDDVQEGGVSLR